MSDFQGRLNIIDNQSSLDNNLLLGAGIPDAQQAIAAATQFLRNRNFRSGQPIIVSGQKGMFGSTSIIVMTGARPIDAQPFASDSFESAVEVAPTSSRKTSKKGAKKRSAAKGLNKTDKKRSAKSAKRTRSTSKTSRRGASSRKRGSKKSRKSNR